MGDLQWPDPRGWEALTQAEASADARARAFVSLLRERAENGRLVSFKTDFFSLPPVVQTALYGIAGELENAADEMVALREALAVAERERDEARKALRLVWHSLPNYGAEGCVCGTHATPDRDCELHRIAWKLEGCGFGYHSAALAGEPQT